jgi:hypothetical protein
MKTITTQLVKNISLAVFISIISVTSVAACNNQNNPATSPVTNLSVAVINNNVFVNWTMNEGAAAAAYCEVQASKDGKNFITIGFVMGADPSKTDNTFSFKQQQAKIKPGMIYFRVLNVIAADKAVSSPVVKLN